MSLSLRTWAELIGLLGLVGVIVWLALGRASLRTELADQVGRTRLEQLRFQAADVSHKSCQASLDRVSAATSALSQATKEAYAATDLALQRASTRDQAVSQDVTRLLSVRSQPGLDCQTALALGQAAWKEGQ